MNKSRDPLAPVEFVLTAVLGFALITLAFALVLSVSSGRFRFRGEDEPCVSLRNSSGLFVDSRVPTAPDNDLPPGTTVSAEVLRLCSEHPTAAQQWWFRASVWAPTLYGLGSMTAAWLLARAARQKGLFHPAVARRVSLLGAVVALGATVSAATVLVSQRLLAGTLLPHPSAWGLGLHMDWSGALFGIGLITLGRVMQHAVAMREELDATV